MTIIEIKEILRNIYVTESVTLLTFSFHLFWVSFGAFSSVIFERVRHRSTIKRTGGWNLSVWLQENFWRGLMSTITVLVIALFGEKLLTSPPTAFSMWVAGFTLDKIIELLNSFKVK
jgi:hypothetical protein